METLAGDTTIGHATAYCKIIEALAGIKISPMALKLRAIMLELERLANHVGDLGALAGDVGFLPTMSYCGRIRGDFLNLTALICGNRFGRTMARPGGVGHSFSEGMLQKFKERLEKAFRDAEGAIALLFESSTIMARFDGTGAITLKDCQELGLVGVVARACGAEIDARVFDQSPSLWTGLEIARGRQGDVLSRAHVRRQEIRNSIRIIRKLTADLASIDNTQTMTAMTGTPLQANMLAVSLVEGWRGEICHAAITDDRGFFKTYKVCDPSFHNWRGLTVAMRNQAISDFPLCNKSFNLSYCGLDL
jgi:Ni,Fe-hydrogenase III large subunit